MSNGSVRGNRSKILIYEENGLPIWYRYLYDPNELDNLEECFNFNKTYQGAEKYAPICQEILDKEEYDKWTQLIDFYNSNPYGFAEEFLGVKLTIWQKIISKIIAKINKIK